MIKYNNPSPAALVIVPIPKVITIENYTIAVHDVLFIKRNIEPRVGYFALPGGYVDEYESIEQAAARELKEETGIIITADSVRLFSSNMAFNNKLLINCIAPCNTTDNLLQVLRNNRDLNTHIQEEIQDFAIGNLLMDNSAFESDKYALAKYFNSIVLPQLKSIEYNDPDTYYKVCTKLQELGYIYLNSLSIQNIFPNRVDNHAKLQDNKYI